MSVKLSRAPARVLTAAKETIKEATKPATPSGTRLALLGALMSPIVAKGYSYVYDMTLGKLTILRNGIVAKVVKIGIPLALAMAIRKLKVPAGNIINGALFGTALMEIIKVVIEAIGGNLPSSVQRATSSTNTMDARSFNEYIPARWSE